MTRASGRARWPSSSPSPRAALAREAIGQAEREAGIAGPPGARVQDEVIALAAARPGAAAAGLAAGRARAAALAPATSPSRNRRTVQAGGFNPSGSSLAWR